MLKMYNSLVNSKILKNNSLLDMLLFYVIIRLSKNSLYTVCETKLHSSRVVVLEGRT